MVNQLPPALTTQDERSERQKHGIRPNHDPKPPFFLMKSSLLHGSVAQVEVESKHEPGRPVAESPVTLADREAEDVHGE